MAALLAAMFLAAEVAARATAPAVPAGDWRGGWASAYAPGVFPAVVDWRMANNVWRVQPPHDWYIVAGYVALNDCARVGEVTAVRTPDGREWPVLVADCGGPGQGQGADWMTANGIVAEVDAALWRRWTAAHGRPLWLEVRE